MNRRRWTWAGFLATSLVALTVVVAASGDVPSAKGRPLWCVLDPEPGQDPSVRPMVESFARLVEKARPAVVALHTRVAAGTATGDPFPFNPWRLFPEVPRQEREEGIGSGFIIRADGYVVTNHHVVANATSVTVRVQNLSAALQARVVGSDPRSDIALLKVSAPRPLPVLPLGTSEDLPVGAWVVAIGNPFGLTTVATKGIVSGKGRTVGDLPRFRPGYFDFIQTDAAIDRGNSGGPLLNLRGEVVGINTAINSRARGIGFAVPVDLAKAVLPHLLRDGQLHRSYLGIRIDPVTWEIAESFGLPAPRGVVITRVLPDTPAERAGFQAGDILLRFDGRPVRGPGDMSWRASTAPKGQPVPITVFRSGREVTLEVVPTARATEGSAKKRARPEEQPVDPPRLGVLVVDLDEKTAVGSGMPKGTRGVVVVGAEADSAVHGVRVGDVIVSVNADEVRTKEEFDQALERVQRGEMIRFYILRQKGALFVALPKRWK